LAKVFIYLFNSFCFYFDFDLVDLIITRCVVNLLLI